MSKWCEHIKKAGRGEGEKEWLCPIGWLTEAYQYCPVCGAKRPEERDELDEIWDKYANDENYTVEQLKKDLLAWTDRECLKRSAYPTNAEISLKVAGDESRQEDAGGFGFDQRCG